jgi:hypothetical protein
MFSSSNWEFDIFSVFLSLIFYFWSHSLCYSFTYFHKSYWIPFFYLIWCEYFLYFIMKGFIFYAIFIQLLTFFSNLQINCSRILFLFQVETESISIIHSASWIRIFFSFGTSDKIYWFLQLILYLFIF